MNKKQGIIVGLIVVGFALLGTVEGVVKPAILAKEQRYEAEQRNPLTHDFSSLRKFKSKYMGDISNFSHLNEALPLGNVPKSYALLPDFAAEITYEAVAEGLSEQTRKQILQYNPTANFVLIDNLQSLRVNLDGHTYIVERSDVEKWYGVALASLQDEGAWGQEVQSRLEDNQFVERFYTQNVTVK